MHLFIGPVCRAPPQLDNTSETEAAECSWAPAYFSQRVRGKPRGTTMQASKIPELPAFRVG
jgi:hypothetical protein